MATVTTPLTPTTAPRLSLLARLREALRPFRTALLRALSAWAV